MSLIDKTYFVLEINIPDSEYNNLTTYIARYEKAVIEKLFGYELGALVLAYTAGSPQRIKDIVEGKIYTLGSGEKVKWNGLVNTDKISLDAYYTYFWYQKNNNSTLQGTGTQKLKSENSSNARAGIKMSTAWNLLEELYGYYGQDCLIPSAYNFLTEHESDYPEWEFTEIGNVNNFDL